MSGCVSDSIFKAAFKRTALHYIDLLELPDLPRNRAVNTVSTDSAACINNRMLQSFAADLTEQQKSDVLNSTLLAQLAADKAYPKDASGRYDVKGWYNKFSEVLLNLGWVTQSTAFWQYKIHGKSFSVDRAILEIINGLLQNNALFLAQATINALKNLPETDNKLTIFKFNTCSDQMGNISLGVCTQKNSLVEYNFAALYLDTKKQFKQILFIDFSTSDFKLFAGTNTITLNSDVYSLVREQVAKKLQDRVAAYMAGLDI
ncbi:hypothetical protein [uncultured Phascolarctobacterium sp.]|uniref:hypothetical protein n=1 Tax=Phascolarctobacterium sp. TaxID=2049039 RepID=UPI0025EDBBA2|nr:hypothetical protein [uncultured Phascolarctobacterium sp.]